MPEQEPVREFLFTGPLVSGYVTLEDGTEYDITPAVVEVDSPEHAAELANKIKDIHDERGTFNVVKE